MLPLVISDKILSRILGKNNEKQKNAPFGAF